MQTHTDVRENPRSGGVTYAASGQELEADVQRKVKLWGVIEAFRDGRLPDNQQINQALSYAEQHSFFPVDKLSEEGQTMIQDVRDIIQTMREIVNKKNSDQIIQETIYQSYGMNLSHAQQTGIAPTNKEAMRKEADLAGQHLRVLATLFLTNGEVRKLVKDFGLIGRDMFATAATKAADAARPSNEALRQVDQAAPEKQWIGADGQVHGVDETPELQFKNADGSQVRYNPKDRPSDARMIGADGQERTAGQAYQQYQDTKAQAKEQAKAAASGAVQGARSQPEGAQAGDRAAAAASGAGMQPQHQQEAQHHFDAVNASRDPNAPLSEQARQVGEATAEHLDNDPNASEAAQAARNRAAQLRDKIPERHRQRAADAWQDTRSIVADAFPEERRELFIWRLKKVLVEVQQHKDYNEAMTWLLSQFETYRGHAAHVGNKTVAGAQAAGGDPQAQTALKNFRDVVERFANGRSFAGVQASIDQIYYDVQQDPELREWFRAADDFLQSVLLEPGFVMEEDCDREGHALYERGRAFFTTKYKGHWDQLWNEVTEFLKAFEQDPLNQRFGDDWKRLTKDLLFNSEGNLEFKPRLWDDVRRVILPSVLRQIGYFPIPRAEYTDEKIDLVIENLILSGPNLIPNIISIENHNFFKFSPYATIKDYSHHRFHVGVRQIQADIRDLRFAFRKKKGFPKLSDSGIADVVLSRNGISIDIEIETIEDRRDTMFKVNSVKTSIDELSFKIRDAKHDMLYKFVKVIATSMIKKAISKAIEQGIRTAFEYADQELTAVRSRMEDAKTSDDTTRTEALRTMFKKKQAEAQDAHAEAKAKAGEFRIVTDRSEQLLPEVVPHEQSSIVQRVWKTEDLARSGQGWHSPAFSLVDPRHPAATGQHHPGATQGAGAGKSMSSAIGRKKDAAADSAAGKVQNADAAAARATGGETYRGGNVPPGSRAGAAETGAAVGRNIAAGETPRQAAADAIHAQSAHAVHPGHPGYAGAPGAVPGSVSATAGAGAATQPLGHSPHTQMQQ